MNIRELIGKQLLFFDGAMGTLLQENGLVAGELPELWSITHEDVVLGIHKEYINSGCNILKTNTFGANRLKLMGSGYTVSEVVTKSIEIAKKAANGNAFVALDMGPTGKLLKPLGELSFEEAYDLYKEQVIAGEKAGADLTLIETMSDTYEIKAAVLAAKENSSLPVAVTMIFNENGKLLTGADIKTALFMLEGLRVDLIGFNCGLGPAEMLPFTKEILTYSSTPIVVNPNAGLPSVECGKTVFKVTPKSFSDEIEKIALLGVSAIGGCCGTTPEHLKSAIDKCKNIKPLAISQKEFTAVSSYSKTVFIGDKPIIIGERINPTGKRLLKEALKNKDFGYVINEAANQVSRGADVLDVNVGMPDIDEAGVMSEAVRRIQEITDTPLQIDTASAGTMEKALRIYNGKPLINSVNGKKEVMDEVFSLAKKYGGVIVCLTLDEKGIPETAKGRIEIAKNIIETAKSYGISKKDLIFDVLTMTISTNKNNANITLEALNYIRNELNCNTCLGVSNISFGLPNRDYINSSFFTLALKNGLSAGIINPNSDLMMNAFYSFCALEGLDDNFETYIGRSVGIEATAKNSEITLKMAVVKGLKEEAENKTKELLSSQNALSIIEEYLIPALDEVGKGFESGKMFLPQLLMSADAAKLSFAVLNESLKQSGEKQKSRGKVLIATVKGDIHDIGKNIVKVLLENYAFDVIDLGKDVSYEKIIEEVKKNDIKLVGLSALMTTTVANMELTIKELKKTCPNTKIMVGGAVLTEGYAKKIGADYYGKDAMESVKIALKILS